MTYGGGFVCRNKSEFVRILLWGFAILSPRRGAVISCSGVWLCVCIFCLGRILSCAVVADIACSGASLCVCVGVLVGFSLHF